MIVMFPAYSPLFTMGLLAPSPAKQPDEASTIYFTLRKGMRDSIELRSFLYLDLADNRSLPRRKCSALSKSTSWTCTSTHDSPRIEKPIIPPVPARRRASKESMRSIPSPKPAPSATLPDPPASRSPPRASARKRPASIVVTSPLTSAFPSPRSVSGSVSSQDRRKSRMDALACLEGRSRAPHRVSRSALRNNFMSFSDDEDERPTPTPTSATDTTHTPAPTEDASAFADVEDEADGIIPMAVKTRPTRPNRKRRSTLESWFPLKSFIDLKDDDLSSWNWRSFIEIGGVV